jgi:hypothetical protein
MIAMTEIEWFESSKPEVLLQFLARKRTRGLLRKLRLFCCATCRQIEPSLPVRAQELVSTVEDLSDRGGTWTPTPTGLEDDQGKELDFPDEFQLRAMMAGTYEAGEKERAVCRALGTLQFMLLRSRTNRAAFTATLGLREAVVAITGKWPEMTGYQGWTPHLTARWDKQGNKARAAFAHLLRHIIGNPFHPAKIDRSWLTPTVVKLSQAIYNERSFDRLPILADALEEAGCTNTDILNHCRGDGLHVRGCWPVDLILGKS